MLKDCEDCLVYGTDNRPLAKARVEVLDEKRVMLYFHNDKLRSVRIRVFVDFYDRQLGVVRCYCEMNIQKNMQLSRVKAPWLADCAIISVQDTFQRQKDLRVDVDLRVEFISERETFFSGAIKNISAGGIFLVTLQPLRKNEQFLFRHHFSSPEQFEVRSRVVRIGSLVNGEYSYGCQFMGLSIEAESVIRKFVYAKQKERMNRKRML